MTLERLGRFWEHTKCKLILYLPSDIYKNSQFPFKPKDQVKIKIDTKSKRMIVEEK